MTGRFQAQPDYDAADYNERGILPPVTIAPEGVTIGDAHPSANWIEARGIHIQPGGNDSINTVTVTVTFLVGAIDVADDSLPHVNVKAA